MTDKADNFPFSRFAAACYHQVTLIVDISDSTAIRIASVYNVFMNKSSHKRLNITLPEETVALLESVAGKGDRSSFIDAAIKSHIGTIKKRGLANRLKAGALDRADRDRAIAAEWANLEDDLWQD